MCVSPLGARTMELYKQVLIHRGKEKELIRECGFAKKTGAACPQGGLYLPNK